MASYLNDLWQSAYPFKGATGTTYSNATKNIGGFLQNGGVTDALSGLSSLSQLYTGAKALQMAKKQQAIDNAYSATNLANQAKTTNAAIQNDYTNNYINATPERRALMQSVQEYMAKNGVSGTI